MFAKIHQYMKDKPIHSFVIIIVIVLIGYYIYNKFFTEHFDLSGMGTGAIISYSSSVVICLIIPYLILYYIVKYAAKNAIRETSQSSQKSQNT